MKFDDHCRECLDALGEDFAAVHRWLDEFAGKPPYNMQHRRVRHHLAGIEEARRTWGDQAAEAARRHVVSDLKEEGWVKGRDPFPKDEADYVRLGLF